MAKKSSRSRAATAAKRAARKNPKGVFVTLIAIILLVAMVFCVLYFGFPSIWDEIIHKIIGAPSQSTQLVLGDGELVVHYIDVGQGDCIFIQLPDGKEMIIDCANYNGGNTYRDETLNYLNQYVSDGQIDYLMLTHCDSDHAYYLDDVLNTYDVDNIFMPNVLATPSNIQKAAAIADLNVQKLSLFTDADTIDTGVYADFFIAALSEEDAIISLNIGNFSINTSIYRFDFYCYTRQEWDNSNLNSAEAKNAISPIGILEYNGRRLVFTGDSNEINEPLLQQRIGGTIYDCDVLKVGHHGSATSSTAAFLDFLNCEYAVISCNKTGNTFNHPRQVTLDRLRARDMQVYRTDLNGNIILTVNKEGAIIFSSETIASSADIFTGADCL